MHGTHNMEFCCSKFWGNLANRCCRSGEEGDRTYTGSVGLRILKPTLCGASNFWRCENSVTYRRWMVTVDKLKHWHPKVVLPQEGRLYLERAWCLLGIREQTRGFNNLLRENPSSLFNSVTLRCRQYVAAKRNIVWSLHGVKTQNVTVIWKPENRVPRWESWLCTENDGKLCGRHFLCSNLLVLKRAFWFFFYDTASIWNCLESLIALRHIRFSQRFSDESDLLGCDAVSLGMSGPLAQ